MSAPWRCGWCPAVLPADLAGCALSVGSLESPLVCPRCLAVWEAVSGEEVQREGRRQEEERRHASDDD